MITNEKNKVTMTTIVAVVCLIVFSNCSSSTRTVENKRDMDFFNIYINNSKDFPNAKNKIADLKLLATGEEYPIRLILFDNNRFYYQIDKLGEGTGYWQFEGGALQLMATRPIFDLEFTITAAQASGDETLVQFADRFGFNSLSIQFRDSVAFANSEKSLQKPMDLKEFIFSNKGI